MGLGTVVLLGWLAATGRGGALLALGAEQWSWALATGVLLAAYVGTWYAADTVPESAAVDPPDARVIHTPSGHSIALHDKDGEEHYNLISALHKSMRNSDPDAAVYWVARMLEAGEDPLYIARRLIRFASEDVGNADPQALTVAVAAKDAAHFIGMPEGNTALAQAAIYLATAPKSNAVYTAYGAAAADAAIATLDDRPIARRSASRPDAPGPARPCCNRQSSDR